MRIAIFTNNYLPNPYGVSTSIETFRRDFEKLGHKVYIFAPNWPGYIDTNPNVFRYPSIDIELKIKFPLAIPYSWKISRIIKNLDLDIIHSQHPNLIGTAAMKWARKKRIPLVFTWHTLYDHYAHFASIIPEKWASQYMIRKAVNYANKADQIVVPTDSITSLLRKWGVTQKITPVPTGIIEEEFQNADRKSIREKFNIAEDEILLLVVTRLTLEKNVQFLFEAVFPVLEKNKKVKFLVVADGHLRGELEDKVKEKNLNSQVIFAGFVPNDIKKHYFAAGDILVWSSKSETQGMVVMEAMYMGLPVVAIDATGTRSQVVNNGNGFLVKENRGEFYQAVQKLINDKDLRKKFGETSFRIAKDNFTSEVCAKKMLEVYIRTTDSH